jgi:hypothetical protein
MICDLRFTILPPHANLKSRGRRGARGGPGAVAPLLAAKMRRLFPHERIKQFPGAHRGGADGDISEAIRQTVAACHDAGAG